MASVWGENNAHYAFVLSVFAELLFAVPNLRSEPGSVYSINFLSTRIQVNFLNEE